MPIKLLLNNRTVCALPIEDNTTKTKLLCLYKYNARSPHGRPLCLDRKIDNSHFSIGKKGGPSIFNWREHMYYHRLKRCIMLNYYGRVISDFINVYNSFRINNNSSPEDLKSYVGYPHLIIGDEGTETDSETGTNSETGTVPGGSHKKTTRKRKGRKSRKSRKSRR